MNIQILMVYLILAAVTAAYCVAIWCASALWSIFFTYTGNGIMPTLWLGVAPLPLPGVWLGAIHWQILAILSLLISIVWGRKRASEIDNQSAYTIPMIAHLAWILFAILLNAIGTLAPMISIGHIIG